MNFGEAVALERLLSIALSHREPLSMSVIELCFSELCRELLSRMHEYMLRSQTCVLGFLYPFAQQRKLLLNFQTQGL